MSEGRCKVDHVIERRGLVPPGSADLSMDEYLVARWTGTDGDPIGYQELTEWFNKRLLKREYEHRGRETIGTRIESDYRVLRGDDELIRREVLDDLESDGIDADALIHDMVSWSTMRRHLKNCLKAEKPTSPSQKDWELESINIAREQTKAKTVSALRSLAQKQRLPGAQEATVDVQIKLSCPKCPTRIPIEDALSRGFVCKDHFDTAPRPVSDGTNPL